MKLNWLFALLFALAFAGSSGLAATPPESADEGAPDGDSRREDPPARVGRISLIEGNVSFYSGADWQRAVLNFPVTSSNAISTAGGARAEIRIGSMALRIEENTELNLTVIDDRTIQLGLPKGSLNVSLRSIGSGEAYQIVTPDTTIDLMRPGRFRVNADGGREIDADSKTDDANGGATRVTVFYGLATATAGAEIITIRGDESALLTGGEPELGRADLNDFDRWVLARDREYEEARSAEAPSELSPETTGYEELDRYGEWRGHTTYGSLWYPNDVPAGWAPYRNGYWSDVAPWGWTWIDYAPWGFAPFHYGRWVYQHNRWGWWPGHYAHYPVYAPALVAYVGHPHSSVSISFGSYPLIGWFPLAPYEAYYPGYGYSSLYLSHLNRGYVRHPILDRGHHRPGIDFANRKFHQAVTVVPRRAFVNERPVAPSTIPVVASPPPALVSGTIPPIAPLAPAIVRNTTLSPTPSVPSAAIGSNIFGRTIAPQAGLANQRLSPVAPGVTARNNLAPPPRPGAAAVVRAIPGNNIPGNSNGVIANPIPGAPIGSANAAGQAGPAGRMPGIPRGANAIGRVGDARVLSPAITQSRPAMQPLAPRAGPSTPSVITPRAIAPGRTSVNAPAPIRSNTDPVNRQPAPLIPRAALGARTGTSISPSIGPSITRRAPAMRSAPVMRSAPSSVRMSPAITGARQNIAPAAVAPAQTQTYRPAVRSGSAAPAPIRGMSGLVGGGNVGRSGGGVPGGIRGFGTR